MDAGTIEVAYAPGDLLCVAAAPLLVVAAVDPGDPVVPVVRDLCFSGAPASRVLAALTRDGWNDLPPFAVVQLSEPAVAFVHGDLPVVVTTPQGEHRVDGRGVLTWVETRLPLGPIGIGHLAAVEASPFRLHRGVALVSGVAQPALSDAAREQPVTRGDGGLPSQAPGLSPALTPANVPAQAQAQAQAQAPAPVPASVVPLLPPHPEGPVGADDDSLPPPPSSLAALAARTAPLVQPALVPPAPEGEAGSPDQPVFRAEWADNDGTVLRPEPPTRHAAGPLADPPARTPLLARSTALGVLRMSTGERHPVEGPMVIGRAPWPAIASDGTSAQPVTVPSPDGQVSRHHVEVTHREGSLYVTDLGSSNGTTVRAATSEQQEQLRAHVPRELQSGMSVYLADEASFVFEAAP